MLFHSFNFFILLSIALVGNAIIQNNRIRILFLLTLSYVFYADASPINLFYIIFSTLLAFLTGKLLARGIKKQLYLSINILISFSILFFFKSYNTLLFPFFKQIFPAIEYHSLSLPLGLSFYTFQTVSYSIEIFRGDIEHENDLATFALYVSFFPQLIAGPIEKAKDLIPQLKNKKIIEYNSFRNGALIFLFGLFKKLIIADRLGAISEFIFRNWQIRSSLSLLIGGYAIAIQYYCDFSAYSEMALGIGQMMGIKLSRNFNFPFLSRSPIEFWRRWHITLMGWLHDYIFSPILKIDPSFQGIIVATMIVFLFSGLWHGVSLNYILWGFLSGLFVILNIIFRLSSKKRSIKYLTPLKIFGTFHIFVLLGLFLYQQDVPTVIKILMRFFSFNGTDLSFIYRDDFFYDSIISVLAISLLFTGEIIFSKYDFWRSYSRLPWFARWTIYTLMITILLIYSYSKSQPYVYYKF